MIGDLKPYPEMKDSGQPWLGGVPAHWQLRRTKTLLRERVEKGYPDEPLLAATQTMGVVRKDRFENRTVLALKDLHLLKRVHVGDFVISLRSFQGGIEFARDQGIISPAYTVLDTIRPTDQAYLSWLFKSRPFIENLGLYVTGIRQGQNIDYDRLSRSVMPLPPPDEQAAIVRFLNHADRRIRRAIRAKQKMIALLNEQKQAIIHHAVTRGLDPNALLKPSDVEWLDDVPEHWEVTRLGHLIDLTTGFPFKSEGFTHEIDAIRLLRGINICPGSIRWNEVVRWPAKERHMYSSFELEAGDIVLGMDRPIIQSGVRVGVVSGRDLPALLLQRVARIRTRPELRADFLMMLLAGKSFSDYLAPIFTGISVPHLSPEQIKSFRFALPSIEEQKNIVDEIRASTRNIECAMGRAGREIDLLHEYRSRLIADVVTGQLDVRAAAAHLPDEAEEVNVAETLEDLVDNDEESLEAELEAAEEATV